MPRSMRSASSQRTWRQNTAAPPSSGTKTIRRILYSLLGLCLTVLLVWLIWWWFFLPVTYFACLPIVDYDVLAVSPIPFSHENSAAFADLGPPDRTVMLGDLQTSEGIATLANRLQGLRLHPKDVLIFSIDAQGVSFDGVAYLLDSDYLRNPASPDAGRYKLHDLLEQIRQSPAGVKLLLLDANHLACDPRLGFVANEFPRLLEEEAKNIDDPSLWILAAAGPLQTSQYSLSARRSLFSLAAMQGLRGAADSNRNGTVELNELFEYIRREVPNLAAHITPEMQIPHLLHGGEGPADPPSKIALAPVLERNSPPLKGDGHGEKDPAVQTLKKLLNQAWTLRDKLQDRRQNDGWSPIDYAPHLWREFNELLLGYERRSRSGKAFDAKSLTADLQENILAWNETAESSTALIGGSKATAVGRLAAARRDFMQNPAKKRLDQKDRQTVALKNALQLKNDLVYFVADYVCWHAAASRMSTRTHPLYQPLDRLLEKLPSFCDTMESWDPARPASDSENFESAMEDILQLRDALENGGLLAVAQNALEAAKKSPRPSNVAAEIDALLMTPLPLAQLRAQLLEIREKIDPSFASLGTTAEDSIAATETTPASPDWIWQRLAEQAKLERLLVLVADPSQDKNLALPETISQVENPESENRAWLAYRQFGKELDEFYAGLPRRINEQSAAVDPSTARSIERLLRLVDARDARRIDAQAIALTIPRLPEIERPKLNLTLNAEKLLQLPREGWLPFELVLSCSAPSTVAADVSLQFDGGLMEIVNREDNQPVSPGERIAVTWTHDSLNPLKLQARAKRQNSFETNVEAEATLGDQTTRTTMNFRLAPLDVVDLLVLEFGRPVESPSSSSERIRLRPFPNRTTNYEFLLINRSGRARKVLVELFALPVPSTEEFQTQESALDTLGNPKPGVKRLAGPIEIALALDDSPTPLIFPDPRAPPSDKNEKSKELEKPKTEKPAEQKPAISLTHGMVCVIRDFETKQPRWIKRIDFAPRAPRDYLQPDVNYDAVHGRISIHVAFVEGQNPPPLSAENPINVVWANVGDLPAEVTVKDRAAIAAPGQTAALFADVESSPNKVIWVRLTADGYPRAFVYRVRTDRDREHIARERSLEEIRIVSPAAGQAYRVPLEKPIPFEVQVDAPEDSFRHPADAVQVLVVAEDSERELCPEEHRWFHGDRQVEVYLNEIAPSGEMKIETKVSDFNIPLNVGGLKNTRARIMSEITLANPNSPEDMISRKAFVPILLQGSPPTLGELIAPVAPIPQGKLVEAYVTVERELSGIKEMQIGIDRDNSGALEDPDKPEKLHQPGSDGKWRVALPTEDLKPGRYTLIARATDVVGFTAKATKTITIAPPPVAAAQKASTTSTIDGRVVDQDGRALPKIRIKLQGTTFSAVSDDNGVFMIKEVPHGKYKLEARGVARNREVSGAQEIVLPQASEPAHIEMRIEL